MSDRNHKNFGHSKKTKYQGSRPNSADAGGRNTPDLRSSSQRTVDPRFGDQSIPGPSYSGQATSNRQRITDPYGGQHFLVPQITPHPRFSGQAAPNQQRMTGPYHSQPVLEATFGGHPVPYSSSQPTAGPRFGGRSIPGPSYSRQPTLNQQRINDSYPGGQRHPVPHLSRQPTVDPYVGDQSNLDPSSDDEPIPKRRRVTTYRSYGDQRNLEPTGSGRRARDPGSSSQTTPDPL